MGQQRILKPGRNCWRVRRAARAAFLLGDTAYFATLNGALRRAEHQVFIVSRDFDSRLQLPRQGAAVAADGTELGALLRRLAGERKALRIHILNQDFPAITRALSYNDLRGSAPGRATTSGIRCAQYPTDSVHRQKLVVIDDRLAFAGSIDLTQVQAKTPASGPVEKNCQPAAGTHPGSGHGIQIAVSGPVAVALGDLAREWWRRATGEQMQRPRYASADDRRDGLLADMHDVDVAVARTEPAQGDYADIREVEQLYLDSIAAAREFIYIAHSHFSAPAIAAALAARLAEPGGPEVILTLPPCPATPAAGHLPAVPCLKLIEQLRDADRCVRFALYQPPPTAGGADNLHVGLMIVDDRFIRFGSSALDDRSLRLDSVCDLAVEAGADRSRDRIALRAFRNRIIGDHLRTNPNVLDDAVRAQGSLIAGIEAVVRSRGYR